MQWSGKLYIDGVDAWNEFGVFVERGGYKGVIQMPAFKKLDTTEWLEYSGEETDLLAPVLDTRQLQLQFCCSNIRYASKLFSALATNGAYHTFQFVELGKTYQLRMVQNGSFSSLYKMGKLTITFANDFPAVPTGEPLQLAQTSVPLTGYELDGFDFSQFGAYIEKSTDDSIRKAANVRENLKMESSTVAGLSYDGYCVHFKSKSVTLKLLIKTASIAQFWMRWNSLFAVLLQPNERRLTVEQLGVEYDCYYKSNSVTKFSLLANGHVWCEFSLELTLIEWQPAVLECLLQTEGGEVVVTEDSDQQTTKYITIIPL